MILHLSAVRFAIAISCFATAAIAQNQMEPGMVTVTFHVVDEFGKTMHYKLERFTRSDGVDFLGRFEGLSSKRIPFFYEFEYKLQPNEPGVRADTLSGKFRADRGDNLIVLRAKRNPRPDGDGGPWVRLCGRLESPLPVGLQEPLWLRLSDLQTKFQQDTPLGANGEFCFYLDLAADNAKGMYMLTFMNGDRILGVQPLLLDEFPREPFVVKLPEKPPALMRTSGK